MSPKKEKIHKLIKIGKDKEKTVIELNLSKTVILLMIIGIILFGLVTKEIVTTIIKANQKDILTNEEEIVEIQNIKIANGDKGYISSAELLDIKTGVGPFDENDEPGNDSSEDNNIVRSFDQITWTFELTLLMKTGTTEANLKGGAIEVEAELPETLDNQLEWDIESMNWLEDANLSQDGTKLTGKYNMSDDEITIPSKKEVIFVLKVKGAKNKTEIQPTFSFKLDGNEENEIVKETAEKVIVSATGKYNIEINRQNLLANRTTVDYGKGNVSGRMYGYGFTVQIYNNTYSNTENAYSKELKGLEFPEGEISFDLNFKIERTPLGEKEPKEDITKDSLPVLWNYVINGSNDPFITDRYLYSETSYSNLNHHLPYGEYTGREDNSGFKESDYSVYNSGDIKIEQEGSTFHVSVKNYEFNGIFPLYPANWPGDNNRSKRYTENIGTFCVGYVQIFVPDTETNKKEDYSYYITVSDDNMNIKSSSQQIITTQMNTLDDYDSVQHFIHRPGEYSNYISLYDKKTTSIEVNSTGGDAKANVGDIIKVACNNGMGRSNDDDIYTANKFFKFDGDAFEPIYFDNGSKFEEWIEADFKVWYVTKKDGTNWTSQEEMNYANIEDMDIYEKIEDIPEGKLCIGIYAETISGYIDQATGDSNKIFFLFKIKETAEIGKTYGMTQRTWYWIEALDREKYTITNKEIKYLEDWPESEWDSGNLNYIKTEYDENGQIVVGTHSGGHYWGNSLLIVGANLRGNIRAIDENNADKVNYDLGKNENVITYILEPQLDANETLISQIEGVVLKTEVILPKGLTYELGSSKRGQEAYTEPEIEENEDGTTTLTWYIYEVTSGKAIEPIKFGAEISNTSVNGQQYETKFVISEYVREGEKPKIGNSEIKNRTSTEGISIINLASFRLYKEVEKAVIEKNGQIHFTITGKNSKDSELPEFVLLDIMPYNEDGRGTKYNGTYEIEKIVITQKVGEKELTNGNLKLYISQDEQIKTATAKDAEIGTSEIWKEIEETNKEYILNIEQENKGVTGIAIKGELEGQVEIVVDIYANTKGNNPGDKYVNSAEAQTQIITEVVRTSEENVQVIGRTLGGRVWLDENYNSIIDNNETLEVTNVDGQVVEAINPNEEGYYEFSHLPAENYVVKIEYDGEEYKLVEKEVGSNVEINSKFEKETNTSAGEVDSNTETGKTDTITKLNDNSNFMIIEENVNAGLSQKINLEFTKVTEENHENTIGGTEFKLYKLVCTEHEEGYHDNEQIDTSNVNSCWELVETEESSSNKEDKGKVKLKDLQVNEQYRLVETKATLNRIKPDGQWKIEFTRLENITDDENSDIIINGNIKVQITAIGNPPGFIQNQENGELLLPNRAYFQFPTSGGIGSKTIYQIGITIFTLGIIILISRKYIVIKKYKNKKLNSK